MNGTLPRILLTLGFSLSTVAGLSQTSDRYAAVRHQMVAQAIEAEGIDNPGVLEAMRTVPRHEFVAPPYRPRAYQDVALPIGAQQTISSPYIVAYMTQTLTLS